MAGNQTDYTRLDQKSVTKFLLAEKCKLFEIYRKFTMCTEKHVFVKKNVYEWAKQRFTTMSLNRKGCPWSGNTLTLS